VGSEWRQWRGRGKVAGQRKEAKRGGGRRRGWGRRLRSEGREGMWEG
jgi:hypothetical protein